MKGRFHHSWKIQILITDSGPIFEGELLMKKQTRFHFLEPLYKFRLRSIFSLNLNLLFKEYPSFLEHHFNIYYDDKKKGTCLNVEGRGWREMIEWSPTGKPVVPQNHTHLRQGFGGSSAGERNPPKHDRLIAKMVYHALTHSSTAKAVISCVGG